MAAPALIMAAAGAQALGTIMQANSQAAMLESQSTAARYNAEVSRQQGTAALQVSTQQQLALRRQQNQQLGRQRAAAAQSGVGLGGSNADLLEQSETLAELDVLNLAYEGALKARGFALQSEMDEFQSRVYQSQVGPTKRAGYLSAIGSLAGGYSRSYGKGG